MRRIVIATGCLAALLALAACSNSTGGTAPAGGAGTGRGPGTTATPVVRQVLASEVDPPGAPGRTLSLVRYTIAPGAQLAPHIHPGVQLAAIESGALTYTVISGTATVTRSGGATEQVSGPATITLDTGDAVAENDGMVHYGANTSDRPIVIQATLLTEDGKDLAVTVSPTGTTR